MRIYHNSRMSKYRSPFGAAICGSKVRLGLEVFEAPADCVCTLRLWLQKEAREVLVAMERVAESAVCHASFRDGAGSDVDASKYVNDVGECADDASEDGDRAEKCGVNAGAISVGGGTVDVGEDAGNFFQIGYELPETPELVWYYFVVSGGGKTLYYGNNDAGYGGEGKVSAGPPRAYQITAHLPSPAPDWWKQGLVYQIYVDRFAAAPTGANALFPTMARIPGAGAGRRGFCRWTGATLPSFIRTITGA